MSDARLLALVSLSDGAKHGYSIQHDIDTFAGVRLGPGTLYGALASLERDRLIEALPSQERRRPYRLTDAGRRHLDRQLDELERIQQRAASSAVSMIRWLLYLYPAWFRRRYGDELIDIVARSPHHGRDVVNVLVHAGRMRWESIVTRPWRYVTNAALAATLFGLGYTINDLASGVGEIHRHWWSTLALAAFVFTAAARTAVAIADARRQETPAPS